MLTKNVKVFSQSVEAMNMNYEQKRFVQKVLKDGKRNGLLLSGNKLKEFKKIKKSISTIGVDFGKCLADDTSHFYAEEKDLEGVPQDVIESMERDENGQLKVTTKYPHYNPVISQCKNPQTRYIMEKTFGSSRCVQENTPRIEELIPLSQRQAEILGNNMLTSLD